MGFTEQPDHVIVTPKPVVIPEKPKEAPIAPPPPKKEPEKVPA